jgi:hypothetical protein
MDRSDAWVTAFASLLFLAVPGSSSAQCSNGPVNVLMGQYDDSRDSVNSNETCLAPASSTFYAADGVTPIFVQQAAFPTILTGTTQSKIFAQPLYVQNVVIDGVAHNIVYVAAMNGFVYAYDADSYGSGSPPSGVLYWATSLTKDCDETEGGVNYPGKLASLSALPYLGILSTPAIDRAEGIMFLVNACRVTGPSNRGEQWFLNALGINSGKPVLPPVMIAGSVANSFGSTVFNPRNELQRPALLLTKDSSGGGEVYIAFGAGVVEGPTEPDFHGWLFGYSANSGALVQQSVFTSTPVSSVFSALCDPVILSGYPLPPNWCGQGGGIWMSGRGPAAAMVNGSAQVFLAVSNGGFQTSLPLNWGESVLSFSAGAASAPSDSFTPSGWYLDENENDEDLGTSGVLLFNGLVNGTSQGLLVVLDKAGNLFLLSQSSLGGFNSPDDAVQEFLATSTTVCPQLDTHPTAHCHEPHSLVFWNNQLYMWPLNSPLRVLQFSNGLFESVMHAGSNSGYPGGMLSLSSNGTSNGILWALTSLSTRTQERPGALTAIDATTLSTLWTSTDAMAFSTFAEATVANGRVYVPTSSSGLLVYANH